MATPILTVKKGDTFPPLTAALSDNNGFIDLSASVSVLFAMVSGVTLVSGACTKLTESTFTCTTASSSPQLTVVSAFTGVNIGSSLIGANIPAGAIVGSFSSSGATINMVDASGNPLNATGSGSAQTITLNRGVVQYAWATSDLSVLGTYSAEWQITWTGPKYQTVPNDIANNPSIVVVANDGEPN